MKYLFFMCMFINSCCFGNQHFAEMLRIKELREQFNQRIEDKFQGIDTSNPYHSEQIISILEEEIEILKGYQMPKKDIQLLETQLGQYQTMMTLHSMNSQDD